MAAPAVAFVSGAAAAVTASFAFAAAAFCCVFGVSLQVQEENCCCRWAANSPGHWGV